MVPSRPCLSRPYLSRPYSSRPRLPHAVFCALLMLAADARADPASPIAALPVEQSAILSDYSKRIRDAVEPQEVRRACYSRTGSYETADTITVCGDALGQQRYRVPREVAVPLREKDTKSPVQLAREVMNAGDGGPVGNTADLGGTGFNPLILGVFGYKVIEKVIENAQEE